MNQVNDQGEFIHPSSSLSTPDDKYSQIDLVYIARISFLVTFTVVGISTWVLLRIVEKPVA